MAQNDLTVFDSFRLAVGNKEHDLNDDTFKFGLVDDTDNLAGDMTRDESDPRWAAGGSVNYLTNQVDIAETAYVGPVTLANPDWAESADVFTFAFDNPTVIAQDLAGPTDIYWMVIYNDSHANKACVCVIDLGGPISLQAGTLTIEFNAAGIYQITG